jgi:hypothetical protein
MNLSDFNLGWQALSIVGVAMLVGIWVVWSNVTYFLAKTIPVRRKSRLLTVSERNLFEGLVLALSDSYFIFSKVGIQHVIEQTPGASGLDVKRITEDIKEQHFDFVLCRQDDMSIFGVVELKYKGKGRESRKRRKRHKLLSRLCLSANLKLFYFDARQDYKSMDIARIVTGKSKIAGSDRALAGTHSTQLSVEETSQSEAPNIKTCPKCRGELNTKVAVKGDNLGEKFLICSKYPYCDYRVLVSEFQKKLREESDSIGFDNWS